MLNTGLGINGPDGLQTCRDLAQENPRVFNLREETKKKLERLSDANQELLRVGL
jgi:NAD(P)H-hydrate repair Nnr-like enzyme with NAD(P)H-hydrate epimerase domain